MLAVGKHVHLHAIMIMCVHKEDLFSSIKVEIMNLMRKVRDTFLMTINTYILKVFE